jgi:hypothetical protein
MIAWLLLLLLLSLQLKNWRAYIYYGFVRLRANASHQRVCARTLILAYLLALAFTPQKRKQNKQNNTHTQTRARVQVKHAQGHAETHWFRCVARGLCRFPLLLAAAALSRCAFF